MADDLGGYHAGRFRDDRINLSRHDRTTGLQGRQLDFTQTCERPRIHPPQIVGDLHDADRNRLELPGKFHGGVLAAQTLEVGYVRLERKPRRIGQGLGDARPEFRVRVDSGADRRAPLGQPVDAR